MTTAPATHADPRDDTSLDPAISLLRDRARHMRAQADAEDRDAAELTEHATDHRARAADLRRTAETLDTAADVLTPVPVL